MTDSSPGAGAEPRPRAPEGELSLGHILRTFLPDVHGALGFGQRKLSVLWKLGACGQAELLGHCIYVCPECQHQHWAPRSCGDRHCPRCLSAKSFGWLEQQLESLLPITYYHGVFTLPQELHALVFAHQKELYPLLFESVAQSLLEFGRQRLGGELGITAVLHTWGQKLDYHPHLHCIITGGALSPCGRRWRFPKQRKFLFPVRAVAALFRGKFLAGLRHLLQSGRLPFADPLLLQASHRERWFAVLYEQRWVVYTKRPFGGPEQVLRYLANYTHRVAISNRRLVAVDEVKRTVSFRYRDYRDASQQKILTLSAQEFIRRFSLHILPHKLVRIRHYGVLGNNRRHRDIPRVREILSRHSPPASPAVKGETQDHTQGAVAAFTCPFCAVPLRLVALRDREGVLHRIRSALPKLDSS